MKSTTRSRERRFDAPTNTAATLGIHPDEACLLALLAWCAFALVAADYWLLPRRTIVLLQPLWLRIAPGFIYGTMDAATAAGAPPGPWWGSVIPFAWWTAGLLLLWVIVPRVLLARTGADAFTLLPPRDRRGVVTYAALLALMLPVLLIASTRADFLRAYPLLHPDWGIEWSWRLLLLFWSCYATILFCTEYFFRGVLLAALAPRLGVVSVAVSTIPYAMIHLHKPAPEAFASIGAGFILGYLAYSTRSIGGGVIVHCAVAIGMDALAMWRKGVMPMGW